MPSVQEQAEQEYHAAPEQNALTEPEFQRLYNLPLEDLMKQPAALRTKFFATCKYHAGQRQACSAEGMVVGDKTAAEILAMTDEEMAALKPRN